MTPSRSAAMAMTAGMSPASTAARSVASTALVFFIVCRRDQRLFGDVEHDLADMLAALHQGLRLAGLRKWQHCVDDRAAATGIEHRINLLAQFGDKFRLLRDRTRA